MLEGNPKLVLGVTWQLILKFEINQNSANVEDLLAWVLCRA